MGVSGRRLIGGATVQTIQHCSSQFATAGSTSPADERLICSKLPSLMLPISVTPDMLHG